LGGSVAVEGSEPSQYLRESVGLGLLLDEALALARGLRKVIKSVR